MASPIVFMQGITEHSKLAFLKAWNQPEYKQIKGLLSSKSVEEES